MDKTESFQTLLSVFESDAMAAKDADLLVAFVTSPSPAREIEVRGRLYSIEHEQGLGPNDLDGVWESVGLTRGFPPVPAP